MAIKSNAAEAMVPAEAQGLKPLYLEAVGRVERLHRRLLADRRFGPMIDDWQRHGAVARRAKWFATATMAACAGVLFLTAPRPWMALAGSAIMMVVAAWLWARPEPPAG